MFEGVIMKFTIVNLAAAVSPPSARFFNYARACNLWRQRYQGDTCGGAEHDLFHLRYEIESCNIL
jgi:hypothetical protein